MHDADYVRIPADLATATPRRAHGTTGILPSLSRDYYVTLDISGRIQRAAQSRVGYRYSAAAGQLELLFAPQELCL